jgi:signal transduction histidine kinase
VREQDKNSFEVHREETSEVVIIQENKIVFLNKEVKLIMIKSITSMVRYEKLKMENHFIEMLTATVSHDMRTPLNAINGILDNMKSYIKED